jgi:hypothetical protein
MCRLSYRTGYANYTKVHNKCYGMREKRLTSWELSKPKSYVETPIMLMPRDASCPAHYAKSYVCKYFH